ncbi:MAG: hypothetical protein FK734_14420 [Asgard group archaeon]|nr:hypothetical protein [Asgard group archaeon]
MTECYICGRQEYTTCHVCRRSICRLHSEEEGSNPLDLYAICTSCLKKKKLKRIRTISVVLIVAMAVIVAVSLILNAYLP